MRFQENCLFLSKDQILFTDAEGKRRLKKKMISNLKIKKLTFALFEKSVADSR